jgi:hypothetical protein
MVLSAAMLPETLSSCQKVCFWQGITYTIDGLTFDSNKHVRHTSPFAIGDLAEY